MSFIISVHVDEGMVFAADQRITFQGPSKQGSTGNTIVHVTDSGEKVFACPNSAGIMWCGQASVNGKPIQGTIKEFIRTRVNADTAVEAMPQMLIKFFEEKNAVQDTFFMVGGYSHTVNGYKQHLYDIVLRNGKVSELDTQNPGAWWNGQITTLQRLVQNVALINPDGSYTAFQDNEILWNNFTLQDAVDFARYAVNVTVQTMRFKNVVETVGGGPDILLITPEETRWLQKEEVH